MKIWRYLDGSPGCQPRLAVGIGDKKPVDLVRAWIEVTGGLEGDVGPSLTSTLQLIEGGAELWDHVETVARAASTMTELQVDESDPRFKWLCPMDVVPSLRDFLAFEDHVKLGAERRGTDVPAYWYEAPVYYKGNHRAIIGPDDGCPWPSYTQQLDFELELAMIVGKRGRDIPRDDAGDYIFGFTIMNDFSARDIQAKEMTAWLGPSKGKDFATALGPCIVTTDEIGTEPDLEMICRVNGEEWGRARSSQAHWRWADMIAHVSRDEDIYPGDVYGSGTPGGCCGADLDRRVSYGDAIELELDRIGILRSLTEASRAT